MKRIENPPNPFESYAREYFEGVEAPTRLEVYEDRTRNILSRNDSPDLPMRWSLNPYRGCAHACAYCYARPSHEYLGFGAGSDFETKILIKPRAPELLREAFMKKMWKGETIVFSGDTDCYQPLEASYQLTRKCLEVCLEFGNPAGIITKSFLITRDLDLLEKLHRRTHLWVNISIPFWDEKTARLMEPRASSLAQRFEAIRLLSGRGIHTGVSLAPLIPGLNDSDMVQILKKAKACGARHAWFTLIRLPGTVKDVFLDKIKSHFPLGYEKILGRIKELRDGQIYNSDFGKRHAGSGQYWDNLTKLFSVHCRTLGLNQGEPHETRTAFKRPSAQIELFQ